MCYVNYSKPSNSPNFLSSSYWNTAICLIADSNTSTFLIKNSLSSIYSPIYYILTYCIFHKKKYDITKYQIKSNTPEFL